MTFTSQPTLISEILTLNNFVQDCHAELLTHHALLYWFFLDPRFACFRSYFDDPDQLHQVNYLLYEAEQCLPSTVFGTNKREAILFLTAHKLSLSHPTKSVEATVTIPPSVTTTQPLHETPQKNLGNPSRRSFQHQYLELLQDRYLYLTLAFAPSQTHQLI